MPVFGTVHIADLFREPELEFACYRDWEKIPRILAGEWPKPHPKSFCHRGHNAEIEEWVQRAIERAPWMVADGEWPDGHLSLLGLGYPGSSILQLAPPFEHGTVEALRALIGRRRMVYWNAKADVPVLQSSFDLGWAAHTAGYDDPMLLHSTLWSELDHDLEFVASIYSDYGKRKHLKHTQPLLYNAGDVADTISCAEALFAELERTPRVRQRYHDRLQIVPIIAESEQRGIAVAQDRLEEKLGVVRDRVACASDLAQASVGYPINIGSADQVRVEVYELENFAPKRKKKTKKPTVDNDAIADFRKIYLAFDPLVEEQQGITPEYVLERIAQGAHPLLEARALHSANDYVDTHYLSPLVGHYHVHHNVEQHTQDNYRWSFTRPPLATFEEALRSIFIPFPGWPWKGWDKDGIELRIIACESQSEYLLRSLFEGWDLHVLTACDIFFVPYPPVLVDPIHDPACAEWRKQVGWKLCNHAAHICGKADPRRGFGKNFRYRRNYGGKPEFAMDIPGAAQLGLDKGRLIEAARQMDIRDPDTAAWWRRMDSDTQRTRAVWDYRGSLRRLMSKNKEKRQRQAYDFPMQAGTQSIMDVEMLQIKRTFKDAVYFVYGAHDSAIWAIDERFVAEIEPQIMTIASSTHRINGIDMPFPASFKPLVCTPC